MYGCVRSVRLRVVSGLRRDGQNWRRTQRRPSRRRAPEPAREPAERFRPIGTKAGVLVAERQHGFTRPVTTACSIRGAPPQPTALLTPEACSANNGVICTPPPKAIVGLLCGFMRVVVASHPPVSPVLAMGCSTESTIPASLSCCTETPRAAHHHHPGTSRCPDLTPAGDPMFNATRPSPPPSPS